MARLLAFTLSGAVGFIDWLGLRYDIFRLMSDHCTPRREVLFEDLPSSAALCQSKDVILGTVIITAAALHPRVVGAKRSDKDRGLVNVALDDEVLYLLEIGIGNGRRTCAYDVEIGSA
jgi:hypothetical protein